jgi:hypothetical protein
VESQLKSFLDSTKESEDKMTKESFALRKALNTLLSDAESRFVNLKSFVTVISKETLDMQHVFSQRELDLMEDAKKVGEERKNVEAMINKIQSDIKNLIAGPEQTSMYEIQKKELETIRKAYDEKSKELDSIDKELIKFNAPRKALTASLEGFQNIINKTKQSEEKWKADIGQVFKNISALNEAHTAEESNSAQQLASLSEELKNVRLELRKKESLKSEEKISALEAELLKTQQELEGSKKILLTHIDTINTLEERIKIKKDTEEFDKDDEMVRINMENHRLNSENAALLSGKQKMETYYSNEIEKLNNNYLKKSNDFDSVLAKFNNLNESIASKKIEELKAWKKRSEVIRKSMAAVEEKVHEVSLRNNELIKFQGQQENYGKEEITLLREEAKKMDTIYGNSRAVYENDKKLKEEEIKVLIEKLNCSEKSLQSFAIANEEHDKVLSDKALQLEKAEESFRKV